MYKRQDTLLPAEGQGAYKVGFKRLYVGVFNPEATKVVKRMTWEDEKGGTVDLNITGLAPDLVDMFASNKRVWMKNCLLYTSPSPRDYAASRMPSSA
ncbi:hypothetical protein JMUB7516_27260 [Staphylococcus aureus]